MTFESVLTIASVVVFDGWLAVFVCTAGLGLGFLIVRGLALHREPLRWQLLLAAGMGMGALSILVLGLGMAGLLRRGPWIAICAALALVAAVRIVMLVRPARGEPSGPAESTGHAWLWLCAAPFLALSLSAATCPPGYLWPAEGNGYDVLEYHFGAPKEWWTAGKIEYLPHNIYSNMPAAAEMLYLVTFVLRGSPWEAVCSAQLVNVMLGLLAIGGAWLAGREFGRAAGALAGLAIATCPFMTYLCGVAYSENGMLAMAALAAACFVRGLRSGGESPRWAAAGGCLAGLAFGFRYVAAPMVALPLGLVWMATSKRRMRTAGLFAVAAIATMGPWLIRNIVSTGNPVFPLARSFFHERPGNWSDEAAARWHEGHLPEPAQRGPGRGLAALVQNVFTNPMFGPVLFAGAALGLVVSLSSRRHVVIVLSCMAMTIAMLAVWAFGTHRIDRFALPIVVPLAILVGTLGDSAIRRRTIVVLLMVVGAAFNLRSVWRPFQGAGVFDVAPFGQTRVMSAGQWPGHAQVPRLNEILDRGEHILLVGEARAFYLHGRPGYCVVFSRNPFAEAVEASGPTGMAAWLREHDYQYVYVGWSEIHRLAGSRYGFWPGLRNLRYEDYVSGGLKPVESFAIEGRPYATLFRVRPGPHPAR